MADDKNTPSNPTVTGPASPYYEMAKAGILKARLSGGFNEGGIVVKHTTVLTLADAIYQDPKMLLKAQAVNTAFDELITEAKKSQGVETAKVLEKKKNHFLQTNEFGNAMLEKVMSKPLVDVLGKEDPALKTAIEKELTQGFDPAKKSHYGNLAKQLTEAMTHSQIVDPSKSPKALSEQLAVDNAREKTKQPAVPQAPEPEKLVPGEQGAPGRTPAVPKQQGTSPKSNNR